MPALNSVQVALDASLSPITAPGAGQPFSESLAAELDNLPLKLLPRAIESQELMETSEDDPVCPGSVQQTYSNLGLFCDGLGTDFACIGNVGAGMARVVQSAAVSIVESAHPGDINDFSQMQLLSLHVQGDQQGTWPAALLQLEADTGGGATAVATMLLLGEVELSNRSPMLMAESADMSAESAAPFARIEATVQVADSISVRDQPRVDTDSVTLVDNQETVTALQRSLDQQWILIETGEGERGWIVAQYLRLPAGVDALPIYDPDQSPMLATTSTEAVGDVMVGGNRLTFNFNSRDAFPGCGEVPPGGILIQSPSDIDGVLQMTVNGADLGNDRNGLSHGI